MAYTPAYSNPYLNQTTYAHQQTQPFQQLQYQQPVNGVVDVISEESALQVQLPPNSRSQPMFNRPLGMFYVVDTDGTGGKILRKYDYSPHVDAEPVNINGAEFASKAEFDQLSAKVEAIIAAMEDKRDSTEPVPSAAAERA